MSERKMPPWLAAVVRRLLPEGYAEEVIADLETDGRRRFGERDAGRAGAGLWYLGQVLAPSMIELTWTLRKREGRAMGRWIWNLVGDARDAARSLVRSPLFTLAAVTSLGVGIAANTAIFSVVNAVLLRPPPYAEPDRLVFVWNDLAGFDLPRLPLAGIQVVELREERDVFEDVAGVWATTRTVISEDRAALVESGLITPNFFAVLGVEPQLGRSFGPDEGLTGGLRVIISDGLWRREFGAAPDVLGRSIRMEGGEAVVVGVLPPDFKLVFPPAVGIPERLDLFVPFPWVAASQPDESRFLRTVARMKPGVTLETADATVKDVASRLRQTYTEMAEVGDEFTAVPLHADTTAQIRPTLLALLAGVGIFLLLTSVNVASLLLTRGTTRAKEIAIRRCLGASGGRIAELLGAEIALLTALGALVGLALGAWGSDLLWALRPDGIARVDDVAMDFRVVGYTILAAMICGSVAACAPLLRVGRRAPMELLRRTGAGATPGRRRGSHVVSAAEVALSVVLVVGAALMARTFSTLRGADLGFEPEHLLTFRVGLSERQFPTAGERSRLARRIEEELSGLPGVVAAGGGSHIPLADWANWSSSAAPEGTPESERESFHFDHRSVTPGYLGALGATVVSGRLFRSGDEGEQGPVVVIDEALAERAFPGVDPVGRVLEATRYVDGGFVPTPAVVVGVIRNIRDRDPALGSTGQVYWPFGQSARWELTYVVRTEDRPQALTDRARAVVSRVSGDLAASDFRTMESYLSGSMADTRFTSVLAALFSLLALGLAGLGLYGVIGYSAARRNRELGLRLALGARASTLFGTVLREGLTVGVPGVLAGLAAAAVLTRYLETLLFGVDPLDPAVFGGVGAFLLLVVVVASAGPAWKATRVDPVRSLQAE